MSELKACPFCGTQPHLMDDPTDGGERAWWVECRECGALNAYFRTKGEAVAAWNRREPDYQELARELAEALRVTLSLLCGFLECPDWEAGTECEHDFRPTCPKIPPYLTRPYDKARKAGLLEV